MEQQKNDATVEMTGAKKVIETLKQLGVDTVFGYPGGAILPIYDALYQSGIRHILTRHEQAAIHAAEGYTKATGRIGTVIATSGPGATNLVTGIADAYMDSVPIVVITGQVASAFIGTDAFQEVDVIGITAPVTKYSFQPRKPEELPSLLVEAYQIASTGRPGPVLIDIPKDIASTHCMYQTSLPATNRFKQTIAEIDRAQMEAIRQAISQAQRPLLYIGGGIVSGNASEELRQLAKETGIPVCSTLMGLGAYPPDDPLFLGMLGMNGTYAANMAVYHCDLLLACGVRFDDRVTGKLERFSPHSTKIHIDTDPSELSKIVPVDHSLACDVKVALQAMLISSPTPDCENWRLQVQKWAQEYPLSYNQDQACAIKPQFVIDLLSKITDGNAIVTTEVGQHQMWAAHFYRAKKPRTFLTSGGLGTMGFGFPAAIGAQIAMPESTVVCIAGDASFQMNIQELQTIAELNIPVKVFIINNRFLGMVRQWQEMFYENRLSESQIGGPDFVKVAEAFRVKGLRAETVAEAEAVIREALAHPGPVVVDFLVEESENVFPMVPPGKANSELIMKGWEE
ncbi:biosynthetic-type acetolactate synthase large subunit [Brevibacillus fluminis]|uniref:Acetolactate synthase n=1 Tax=Brevibacillus fluminis TaxID=511487 RepID=A0A3M8D067_9BACL|nr:biosynthetic-type acetolactate synthase large subunit [Brevibacillus fluminis]RNB81278.1 biosynthetic-type acetolactate synthase large subunit [Brevibacillus fluminis]